MPKDKKTFGMILTYSYNNELPFDKQLFNKASEIRGINLDTFGNHRHFRITYLIKPEKQIIISYLL